MTKYKANKLLPLKQRMSKEARERRARKKQRRIDNKKVVPNGQ